MLGVYCSSELMATVLADRKERRRKWWAQQVKAKTESKINPKAVGVGDGNKKKRRHVDCLEGGVREHAQFEEKQTQQSFLNTSGFRSSQTIPSSTEETPQNNLRIKNQGSTGRKNTTTSVVEKADILESRRTETLPTECGGEESTSDSAGSDSDETVGATEGVELAGRKRRYIAFIGNLPFSVTRDDVMEHFAKRGVKILDARLLTKRGSGESRGCCFAEFPNTKTLQNALKFHHSLMDGRRLNVEVTCGGGGRGEGRMKKIRERNESLRKARRKRVKRKSREDS